MNADKLKLVKEYGHSVKIGGMRESCYYVIENDAMCGQWDTVIHHIQYTVKKYMPRGLSLDYKKFLEEEREDSKNTLKTLA